MVFGTRRVPGLIGAWEYDESAKTLALGVVFAVGEQDSISTSTTYINGEVITSAGGVASEGVHVGDGSTALSSVLTGMDGWVAADTTLWKQYAHAVMVIDCKGGARAPGNLRVETDLGGMLIDASWRDGGSASTASVNPVEIAYYLNTSALYRGVSSARIHTASWAEVADWCDEVMGDASARYEINGVVDNRDPAAGVAEVLGMALAYEFIGDDGLIHLWAEKAPPPVTGEWSATASATITEDSTAGEATTELSAGDYVFVGTNLRLVSSVTDDDTVVLDSAVTVSGVRVRPLSQIYIQKYEWAHPLHAFEASKLSTPDKYRVRFTDGENRGSHELLSSYGAGTDKIIEAQLPGCTSATVAARISETTLKVAWLEPFFWRGVVWQDIGAQLELGDVVLFDDDLLTAQAARVIPTLVAQPDGTYVINLREFDPSAYSESTDTTDTVPALGTGWTSGSVPIVQELKSVYGGTEYTAVGYDGSGRAVYGDATRSSVITGTEIRLPNNVPIYGLKTGGSTVQMLKMDTSDRLVLGDGAEPVYINSSTGGGILVPDNVPIVAGWASAANRYMIRYVSGATELEIGSTASGAPRSTLLGRPVELNSASGAIYLGGYPQFDGITSDAGDPTTTHFAAGAWGIYKNTTSGAVYAAYNDGGTIRKVQLA